MDEREVTSAQVEREHFQEVRRGAHWAYVAGVLGIGFLAMLAFIGILGATIN